MIKLMDSDGTIFFTGNSIEEIIDELNSDPNSEWEYRYNAYDESGIVNGYFSSRKTPDATYEVIED